MDLNEEEHWQALVRRHYRMLIGGQLVDSADGTTTTLLDPLRNETLCEVPAGSAADVDLAVAAAKRTYPQWRRVPIVQRADRLRELAAALDRHADELVMLDTLNTGTPRRVLRTDVDVAADRLRSFAGLALQLRGETVPTDTSSLDFTARDPFGVVGRIVPFNHPLMFAATSIAAPLLAGNTTVLKPSEATPLSALRLGEIVKDVLPAGVLNVVSGDGTTAGDHLVRHRDVPRIAFTGGVDVGRAIQSNAATHRVKVVTLELGGKNPLLVFPDADLTAAADGAIRGMNFTWQGQSCGSTSRLYIHASVFDAFVEELARKMDAMVMGDPRDDATEVGAIATRAQYDKIVHYIESTEAAPEAKLLAGGQPDSEPAPGQGLFVRPTLFVLPRDTRLPIATNEVFGPVLIASPFDTYDEAITSANALPVGLTASVWTRSLATAMNAARDLETGYLWVNWSSTHVPGTAFGGVKDSGVGREEGIEELYGYTQAKNVYVRFEES